ncbi:AMP-activated serine/threonine-protein kinase regulatory subunit [Spiromyces aspiralis]|uniref:AMP-activated serine/threonine-protein kinase regulatory subunit n=1 Tax=Spiromyces aspiralis TaxID=68401 RepID=A0ACC1HX26_9FUNG|nr:AMP-activated serine/threonine-protein kinase regulatory subunit [Spiromyces aspiralis]
MEIERASLIEGSVAQSNDDSSGSQRLRRKSPYSELTKSATSFLKEHTAYDMIPVSSRLIVLDTKLLVTKALSVLLQNGIDSTPMWDSETSAYAGMLTTTDLVNLIQYYYANFSLADALDNLNEIQLDNYQGLLKRYKSRDTNTLCANPLETLYDISKRILYTDYSALALVDEDKDTGAQVVVSMLSIYQILNFMAMNFSEKKQMKRYSLYDLNIGTYGNLVTATLSTSVIDIVNLFVENNISVVPILNEEGAVINAFAESDIMHLIREGYLAELDMPVSQAIANRPDDYPGVHTCKSTDTLFSVLGILRKTRLRRLIVVDDNTFPQGVITLSDVLRAFIAE